MKKFEDIKSVAQALGDGGPFNPDINFNDVREVVDTLIELGNSPKVFAFHDDHLGLKDRLSDSFLNSAVCDADNQEYEEQAQFVIEQANRIIGLAHRELSEDDIEEIKEDRASRGYRDTD